MFHFRGRKYGEANETKTEKFTTEYFHFYFSGLNQLYFQIFEMQERC